MTFAESARSRFAIEPLEERIAPTTSLLTLNLTLTISNVTVTVEDVNIAVSGNVIQVGVLSTGFIGTVSSTLTAS